MKTFLSLVLITLFFSCQPKTDQLPMVSSGQLIRINSMPSKYIDARNVDIWLPDGYNTNQKYAVIYMHDGQMLFDSAVTWNKQEWKVDEVLSELMLEEKIKDCIVVGIWNNGQYRHTEYFPQQILDSIPVDLRNEIIKNNLKGKPLADNYLKFMVEELKPFIDNEYSTLTDPSNTVIMGSSMGGLISLYAFCEYPNVFGCAGCISTHWPLILTRDGEQSIMASESLRKYISANLPLPEGKKIYFDYGNQTLDSLYKPHQMLVDEIMKSKEYSEANWVTFEFLGDDHSEKSWSRRLSIPLQFLLKN